MDPHLFGQLEAPKWIRIHDAATMSLDNNNKKTPDIFLIKKNIKSKQGSDSGPHFHSNNKKKKIITKVEINTLLNGETKRGNNNTVKSL